MKNKKKGLTNQRSRQILSEAKKKIKQYCFDPVYSENKEPVDEMLERWSKKKVNKSYPIAFS